MYKCFENVIKNNGNNCKICKKKFNINNENDEIETLVLNRENNDITYDNIKLLFILLIIFFFNTFIWNFFYINAKFEFK